MNNVDRLLDKFKLDPKVNEVLSFIKTAKDSDPVRIKIPQLGTSHRSFFLSSLHQAAPQTILFIASDKEEAAYVQNDLDNLLSNKMVFFFPDSFKRPTFFEVLHSGNVLERTETVNKITGTFAKDEIVVTYPEALFEKVVAPQYLEEKRIDLEAGKEIDIDFIFEYLIEFGFKNEEFVVEPGQFSIRGGIIDIFSYGNDYPYRIELFDETIESIRTFNPMDQLSVKNISRVSIIPNINTKFSSAQKTSILKILAPETLICVSNFEIVLDKLQTCFEKAEAFAKTLSSIDDSELAEVFRSRAFITPTEIIEDIRKFALIGFSQIDEAIDYHHNIKIESKPQPSFNKNFKLLIEDLNRNTKAGIENYLFTDNSKQIERFYSIFQDLEAKVQFQPITKALSAGFIAPEIKIACYTDHQIFDRFHRYKLKRGFTKDKALNLRMIRSLEPGDFVTHIDHGVGRYSGLEKINITGRVQESVRMIYKNNDILYVSINSLHKISKYIGKDGSPPKLSKLGSEAWKNLKRKTKKKVKDIASELIKLYAKRKSSPGFSFPEDGYLQNELEASFIYEDTPDQLKATNDVKADMILANPMDRLICGDVGFGKTEIAIRAAFKSVIGGKQVAILVPTTILALQHYKTFSERLAEFDLAIDYVNRFRTTKERKEIFAKLKEGKIDIVIGTHGLLSKDVGFKDLGLLVIDEEQKFGVSAKEKLRGIKVDVDTLTLTATPIPRTLQFSLMAARDLSILRTPPPNRQPIHTENRVLNNEVIKEAIYYEVNRGGQVFFVHNRVKTLPEIGAMIQRLCPDVDVALAHGQLDSKTLEETLINFIDKKYDVLICTNIIETGLDIPNANTIMINNAHQFGLSDLHQLRGRVGRSNKKAFCYLFSPPQSVLTSDARKRLKTLEEHSDLGSGFNIAMRDLDIRGAGNLLGAEQSGFISEIGYETFQKILEEAIHELKETEFKDLFAKSQEDRVFVRDVQIDTDVEMLIPDEYVSNIQERLSLYTQLDKIEKEPDIAIFEKMLRDRFGKVPKQVYELFAGLRLRWISRKLGFERIILKNGKLRCYFIENPQSTFYDSLVFQSFHQYLNQFGAKENLHLKQAPKSLILIKEKVGSLKKAKDFLLEMEIQIKDLIKSRVETSG